MLVLLALASVSLKEVMFAMAAAPKLTQSVFFYFENFEINSMKSAKSVVLWRM